MTRNRNSVSPAWAAFVVSAAAVAGVLCLSYRAHPPAETTGYAEFRPPPPPGHPGGVTVRIRLPQDFRARPTRNQRGVEAGVANARGEPQFYAVVRLAPASPGSEGETRLQAFAREQKSVAKPNRQGISTEFRTTVRGPVWLQRYTEMFQESDLDRAGLRDQVGGLDRLPVLRYAEEWDGLILELAFHIRPDRVTELEPLAWDVVRDMRLTVHVATR